LCTIFLSHLVYSFRPYSIVWAVSLLSYTACPVPTDCYFKGLEFRVCKTAVKISFPLVLQCFTSLALVKSSALPKQVSRETRYCEERLVFRFFSKLIQTRCNVNCFRPPSPFRGSSSWLKKALFASRFVFFDNFLVLVLTFSKLNIKKTQSHQRMIQKAPLYQASPSTVSNTATSFRLCFNIDCHNRFSDFPHGTGSLSVQIHYLALGEVPLKFDTKRRTKNLNQQFDTERQTRNLPNNRFKSTFFNRIYRTFTFCSTFFQTFQFLKKVFNGFCAFTRCYTRNLD
jgi:hypothetical protein